MQLTWVEVEAVRKSTIQMLEVAAAEHIPLLVYVCKLHSSFIHVNGISNVHIISFLLHILPLGNTNIYKPLAFVHVVI